MLIISFRMPSGANGADNEAESCEEVEPPAGSETEGSKFDAEEKVSFVGYRVPSAKALLQGKKMCGLH